MSLKNHKLTKKLQVLLTEDEVLEVNRLILNEAVETQTRPISVSSFIRELIQREIKNRSVEQSSIVKKHINKLKEK